MRYRKFARLLAAPLIIIFLCVISMASAGEAKVEIAQLPTSAWRTLENAQGIRVGGGLGGQANIQIIFDANCPYCAQLYGMFRRKHPNVAIRWIPIGYLTASSKQLAAAILASPNPAKSLDYNFEHYHYDFKMSHGGYPIPKAGHFELSPSNIALAKQWNLWGGYTPMIIFRDKSGRILRTGGARPEVIRAVLERLQTGLQPGLQPYNG